MAPKTSFPMSLSAGDAPPALTRVSNLVDDSPKQFYSLEIPVHIVHQLCPQLQSACKMAKRTVVHDIEPYEFEHTHYQLRHYLSIVDNGTIYYASKNEIFAIKDGQRRLVAWVDFKIQCLAAAHGWICVGGPENGRFAYGNLTSQPIADDSPQAGRADERPPLGSRTRARSSSPEGLRYLPSIQQDTDSSASLPIYYRRIGTHIVNAVTIQKITPIYPGAKPEVVALLANNDHTVTIFSLDQLKILQTLDFQYPMNHASVSEDGLILIACGDINQVFFFEGKALTFNPTTGRVTMGWRHYASPELAHSPPGDDCFSTAFSPDRQFCSIASESGMLAIYDLDRIKQNMSGNEALWQQYSSSRPGTHVVWTHNWPGAIRSVAYSPVRPKRLMAFAEGRGRVCIADLDTPYRSPQVIEFRKNDPSCTKLELCDLAPTGTPDLDELFSRTFATDTEEQDSDSNIHWAADLVEDAAQRDRLQELLRRVGRSSPSLIEELNRSGHSSRSGDRAVSTLAENTSSSTPLRDIYLRENSQGGSLSGRPPAGDAPTAASSNRATLAPTNTSRTNLSASPARLQPTDSSEGSLWLANSLENTTSESIDPWFTASAAMASAARDSRRAYLQQNLRNLRDTRDSLERAQRMYRERASDLAWTGEEARREYRTALLDMASSNSIRADDLARAASPFRRSASVSRARRSIQERNAELQEEVDVSNESRQRNENVTSTVDQAGSAAPPSRWRPQLLPIQALDTAFAMTRESTAAEQRVTPRAEGLRPSIQEMWEQRQARLDRHSASRSQGRDSAIQNQTEQGQRHQSANADNGTRGDELDVMGMSWTPCGTVLVVATTGGIFKLKVSQTRQRTFAAPAIPL